MTIACEDRDFPEWHGGAPHAYLWGVRAPVDLAPAHAALSGYLLPRYDRDPHVTVAFCGLSSQFGPEVLDDDLRRLEGLAEGPVTVHPDGWATFLPSPMLRVRSDWLTRAHLALSEGKPDRIPEPYTPHVTIGFYGGEFPLEEPLARLATLAQPEPWTVTELELLRYDTHDIAGPLTTVGAWNLTSGRWSPAAES